MSETSPPETKRSVKVTYIISAIAISCLMIGASVGIMIMATTPSTPTVLEPGSMIQNARFVIFKDGSSYYAKNGTTGALTYSGTNATTVIESAFAALPHPRYYQEAVQLVGQFTVTHQIGIPSYTYLNLEGANLTLSAGVVEPILTNSDHVNGNSNITIIGGELSGNQPTQTGSGGYGIYLSHVADCVVRNVHINQADLDAIFLDYSKRCLVESNTLLNCAEGILLSNGCFDNMIRDNFLKNMKEQDGLEVSGISSQSARNSFINNVVIGPTPSNTGIDVFYNSVDTIIEGNTFTNTGGLSVAGASAVGCDGTVIRGNIVTDTTGLCGAGIQIGRGANYIVEGNTVRNMNGTGIVIAATTSYVVVSNNVIENVGKVAGGAMGISIAGGSKDVISGNFVNNTGQACLGVVSSDSVVSGNILSYPGAPVPYPLYMAGSRNTVIGNHCSDGTRGISLNGDNHSISGNDLRGNSAGGINDNGVNCEVRNNIGWTTENDGNVSITGAVNTVTFVHGLVSIPILILVTSVQTGAGNVWATTYVSNQIIIHFDNQPGGATWYFHWYAQTW